MKTLKLQKGFGLLMAMVFLLFLIPTSAKGQLLLRRAEHRLSISNLTVEHMSNPLGIDTSTPRFGWIVEASYNGAEQTAYEIRVSSKKSRRGDVWSSNRISSSESFDVEYDGEPLQPNTRYYWSVRVWDSDGRSSRWSKPVWFETAFLDESQFGGEWIGSATTDAAQEILLRKEFSLTKKGKITSARAYIAGLGYYKLYINDERVGDHELDPGYTIFDKTVLYVTHDVTDLLQRGDNAIGVSLGQGYYGQPVLKLQLDVTYANGATDRIVSDLSWKAADGPTTSNSVIAGEIYDARLEPPGWKAPGFDDSGWDDAITQPAPGGMLKAQDFDPIRETGELPFKAMIEHSPGVYIYDFETTRAGWATVSMEGPAGAQVTMRFGERLDYNDGTVHTGGNRQTYRYTLRGEGVETFTPSYSYNGYRYLQVDVPDGVTVLSVIGKTVHTDVSSTGDFECSDELLNRYHKAMRASILSNIHSIPTDTPMYEKRGWTADGFKFSDSALLNFASETFWEKWMDDHRDNQFEDGRLPVFVPGDRPADEPVWTASYILVNWNLYERRGNIRTLEENYDEMMLWMDYYEDLIASTGYLYTGPTYGDHEGSIPGSGPGNPQPAPFPRDFDAKSIGTAFIYHAATTLADIARVLDHEADAVELEAFAITVRDAYNEALYDPVAKAYFNPEFPTPTGPEEYWQVNNAVPLAFGMVPEEDRQAVFENLLYDADVTWDDNISTGSSGTKYILPMLTEGGDPDLAYRAAVNPIWPGWGYWFETVHGTWTGFEYYIVDTMWEAWCWGRTIDCAIDPARSHNHAFFGTVDDWLFEYVAGIKPIAPAYREIQIKPYPVGDLTEASAHITSPLGKVSSSWTRSGESLTLDAHIPVGATAEVLVPVVDGDSVRQEGGAEFVGIGDGYAKFEVGSGDYKFWTEYKQDD